MNQLGEEGMAVFTVCDNVLLIVEMLTGGIIGVIPNVAGILFGEKDYVGIRVLCKKMLKYSYILLAVIFVLIMLFTEEITVMFGSGGGELGSHMVQASLLCVWHLICGISLLSAITSPLRRQPLQVLPHFWRMRW